MAGIRYLKILLLTGVLMLPLSCLKEMPESEEDLPQKLEWNPAFAFPLGSDSFGLNEASGFDTTLWEYDTIDRVPKWVKEVEVVMEGRVPFDLSSYGQNTDDMNEILFRVNLYNGFPHEVLTQAYLIDIDQNLLDSMFTSGAVTVNPGGLKGDGEIIDPAVLRKDAVFGRDRIGALEQATEILLRAVILNPEVDSTLIPYYRNYHFDVDVGIMVDLTLDL